MSLSTELSRIARALNHTYAIERVLIHSEPGAFKCSTRTTFWHYLPGLFSRFYPVDFRHENRQTIAYFYKVFGQRRIHLISDRYGLSLAHKYARGISLSRRDIEKLFIGLADIRGDDLRELLVEIQTHPKQLRHLNPEQTALICQHFAGKNSLRDLEKADFDLLYKILIPFAKIQHIFLNSLPRVLARSDRSDSFNGRRNRVFLIEEMRRNPHVEEMFWEVRMAKRLVHNKLGKGVMIPHPKGYFEYHAMVEKGGVFKLLFKLPGNFPALRPLVVYLSTRTSFTSYSAMESKMEDLRRNIGIKGIKATYDETRSFLSDSSKGFLNHFGQQIWLLGMSLGGTHASRDACLFLERTDKLTTVSSPGVDKSTHTWLPKALEKRRAPLHIRHITEEDDVISDIGDGHLGIGCNPAKAYVEHYTLAPENPTRPHAASPERITVPQKYAKALKVFFISFISAHGRETMSQPHRRWRVDNFHSSEKIDRVLHNAIDASRNKWEEWRKRIATGLDDDFYRFLREKRRPRLL